MISSIFIDNSSEDISLPFISREIIKEFWGILAKILSPSFFFIKSISLSDKFSGAFSSMTSIILRLQYLDSLFENSLIPSWIYFSLILPTAIILMFIINLPSIYFLYYNILG